MMLLRAGQRRVVGLKKSAASAMYLSVDSNIQRLRIPLPDMMKEVQFKGSRPFDFHVFPSHGDHVEIGAIKPEDFQAETQPDGKSIRIVDNTPSDDNLLRVELHLPSQLDLNVSLVDGTVSLHEKVEGDVTIAVGRGDVHVNKVRGTKLRLVTNDGSIHVDSLIEGENVFLQAKQIDCKRLMAKRAEISLSKHAGQALDSKFGALYTSLATIQGASPDASLMIGNVHGALDIRSDNLRSVHVDSVNGSLSIEDTGDSCNLDAHFDAIQSSESAENRLIVGGDAKITVAPSLEVAVELHGTSFQTGKCSFDKEYEVDQLDDDYVVANGILQPTDSETKFGLSGSGKIDLNGAKASAMSTSFFNEGEVNDTTPNLFVHAVSGTVTLMQLSWMDKIRAKHQKKIS